MRTLVTGASGFLGSHLVRTLMARGEHVVALVRPGSRLWRLEDVLDEIEIVEAELTELTPNAAALAGVRVMHHLAAAGVDPRAAGSTAILEANVLGTQHLLEVGRMLEVERFVYCGSCFEYGAGHRVPEDAPLRPRSVYAASKSAGWLLAQAAAEDRLPVVSLRPFTAYGPYEAPHRLVPSCALRALDGESIELTEGEQRRDLVYVGDVAEAFADAASAEDAVGQTFNVCSGIATRVRDVAAEIAALAGTGSELKLGALARRPGEADELSGDPSRAEEVLGFRAKTPLRKGLEHTLQWFREHRGLYEPLEAAR